MRHSRGHGVSFSGPGGATLMSAGLNPISLRACEDCMGFAPSIGASSRPRRPANKAIASGQKSANVEFGEDFNMKLFTLIDDALAFGSRYFVQALILSVVAGLCLLAMAYSHVVYVGDVTFTGRLADGRTVPGAVAHMAKQVGYGAALNWSIYG